MAPVAKFEVGQKVFCYHNNVPYPSKIVRIDEEKMTYWIHYNGWNTKWDEWVTEDRILEATPENEATAKELQAQAKTGKAKGRKSKAGADKSGSVSVSSSRTSTPTPTPSATPPGSIADSTSFPAAPTHRAGHKRGHSISSNRSSVEPENAVDGTSESMGPSSPKKARRATRSSVSGSESVAVKKERDVTPSPVGSTRTSRARDVVKVEADSSVETPPPEGRDAKAKENVKKAGNEQPKVKRELRTSKVSGTENFPTSGMNLYTFDPSRVSEDSLNELFQQGYYDFFVPRPLQEVVVFDAEVFESERWIPVVPARKTVKEIFAGYLERMKAEKDEYGVEDAFIKGYEAIFNDMLPVCLSDPERETFTNDEKKNYSEIYGVVHLLRLNCYLPQVLRLANPNGSALPLVKQLEQFFRFLADNASEFLAPDDLVYTPVAEAT